MARSSLTSGASGHFTENRGNDVTAYVAQLLGVYLVLSGVLMIVREQAMMLLVPKFVDLPPFLYFLGSLRVLIGLAIVLAHNMGDRILGSVIYVVAELAHDFCVVLPCSSFSVRTRRKPVSLTWQRLVHNSDRRDVLGGWLAYAGFTGHKLAGAM